MKISLVEMGKTKKRNVRESIISILSRNFPLSIRKIYNSVKKDYKLGVTYQAVFKMVKGMMDDGIIEKEEKEYRLNMGWIKQLEDELSVIRNNYNMLRDERIKEIQGSINKFISKVGPQIKNYIDVDSSCIIGVSGGGRIYGMALWRYLVREGLDSKYINYDPFEEISRKGIGIKKEDVRSKKVILVDSAIHSGKTYEVVMRKINKHKKILNIKDIKFAVDRDMIGLADFSRISN